MQNATLLERETPLAPAQWAMPAGAAAMEVNHYPMAYAECGAGTTVLLVHGSLSDYRYWAPQFAAPPAGFRLVAVSLRHYYPEPWDGRGDDFTVAAQADDLAAFMDRLGPVHLVAWSRGGSVALGAVKRRPELVMTLVLMEPVISCLRPKDESGGLDPAVVRLTAVADFFGRGDIEGGLRFFVDDLNGPGTWEARTPEQRQLARDNAWTLVRQLTDADAVTPDDLRRMAMPVLLVGGERGPPFLAATMDAAQPLFPRASRVTIPNAGHLMNRDNPLEFNRTLTAFLSAS